MENLIQVNSVTKDFTGHRALDNVNINVPKQSIYGLLGPNGAGKTTLIRIINQIIGPDNGYVLFNGEIIRPDHVEKIGYLPEERGLYKKMKVGEQALYLAQLKGLKYHQTKKMLEEWFRKFDLTNWWNKKAETLSKGMQQKLQFIITVLHNPKLLIFDEPFSGFDPINVNILKDEILKLRENGATIIFSTHDMSSVEELCDEIALINKSKKILEGNVRKIKKEYAKQLFRVEMNRQEADLERLNNNDFEIIKKSIKEDIVEAVIRINNHKTTNDLLEALIETGNVVSFNEVIPSMNEIFIRSVSEQQ